MQPASQQDRWQRAHMAGSELDGQRQAVDRAADLGDIGEVGVELEPGIDRGRGLGEQSNGIGDAVDACLGGERLDVEHGLTGDSQPRPAGDEHPQIGRPTDDLTDERCCVDHVLEVVEHEQAGASPQDLVEHGQRVALGGEMNAEVAHDQPRYEFRVAHPCEIDEACVETALFGPPQRDLGRQSRLADAARAEQCDDERLVEQLVDAGDRVVATDRHRRRAGHGDCPTERVGEDVDRLDRHRQHLLAQGNRHTARFDSELAAKHGVQEVELAEGTGTITSFHERSDHAQVGVLVRGVGRDQRLPSLSLPEQLQVAQPATLPWLERPLLVRVVGEQITAIHGDRRLGVGDRRRRPRGLLQRIKAVDVDA